MESFDQNTIRHRSGLLDLVAGSDNIFRACRMMGVSRDTSYRCQAARDIGDVEALFYVSRHGLDLKTERTRLGKKLWYSSP